VQTQKLASLGQLTAGIAHEIKNPLNFVSNFSGVSVEMIDELREALGAVKVDIVLAFPGGRGTADIIARAEQAGVEVVKVGWKA
jgi:signal transduction histidine kinase